MPKDKYRKTQGSGGVNPKRAALRIKRSKLKAKLEAEARKSGITGEKGNSIQDLINSGDIVLTPERQKAGFKPPERGSQEWKKKKEKKHNRLSKLAIPSKK
jgi:hypothetical protein